MPDHTPTQQRILRDIEANRAKLQAIHGASCGTGVPLPYARLFPIQEDNLRLKAEWEAELARIADRKKAGL